MRFSIVMAVGAGLALGFTGPAQAQAVNPFDPGAQAPVAPPTLQTAPTTAPPSAQPSAVPEVAPPTAPVAAPAAPPSPPPPPVAAAPEPSKPGYWGRMGERIGNMFSSEEPAKPAPPSKPPAIAKPAEPVKASEPPPEIPTGQPAHPFDPKAWAPSAPEKLATPAEPPKPVDIAKPIEAPSAPSSSAPSATPAATAPEPGKPGYWGRMGERIGNMFSSDEPVKPVAPSKPAEIAKPVDAPPAPAPSAPPPTVATAPEPSPPGYWGRMGERIGNMFSSDQSSKPAEAVKTAAPPPAPKPEIKPEPVTLAAPEPPPAPKPEPVTLATPEPPPEMPTGQPAHPFDPKAWAPSAPEKLAAPEPVAQPEPVQHAESPKPALVAEPPKPIEVATPAPPSAPKPIPETAALAEPAAAPASAPAPVPEKPGLMSRIGKWFSGDEPAKPAEALKAAEPPALQPEIKPEIKPEPMKLAAPEPPPLSEPSTHHPFDPRTSAPSAPETLAAPAEPPTPASLATPTSTPPAEVAAASPPPPPTAQESPGFLSRFFKRASSPVEPEKTQDETRTLALTPKEVPPSAAAETLAARTPEPEPQPKVSLPPSPQLLAARLGLGANLKLGQAFNPQLAGQSCFTKSGIPARFCAVPVDWPEEMAPLFRASTILYSGQKSVVRFENDKAVRAHVLFPAAGFDAVAGYLERLYGPPTDRLERRVRILLGKAEINPLLMWRKPGPDNRTEVIDLRRYDDSRRDFPDTSHGAVRVYYEDSTDIFTQISMLDFLLRK